VRYAQFCALARAAEIVGERWTLLIVRELLLGPKRFVDLRGRLDGVSPSVLAARLGRAEAMGLVRRRALPPPAASVTYELTEDGLALRPAVHELIRWGGRRLLPMRRGERVDPDWMRLALAACARRGRSPARAFRLRIVARRAPRAEFRVIGGARGTTVVGEGGPADATIVADVRSLLALVGGRLKPAAAVRARRITVSGRRSAVLDFPRLFDPQSPTMPAGRRRAARAKGARP
jgi:DNA-binding HxlR family transcriptional regulator